MPDDPQPPTPPKVVMLPIHVRVDADEPERIVIHLWGFPSGAECQAICNVGNAVARLPMSKVGIESAWSIEPTQQEEACADIAIDRVLAVLLRKRIAPRINSNFTSPQALASVFSNN